MVTKADRAVGGRSRTDHQGRPWMARRDRGRCPSPVSEPWPPSHGIRSHLTPPWVTYDNRGWKHP
ncbi:hypothetical protein BDM02DRAFT_3114079 [Thelephora ganbajun]|uniref:Uncharacterized protein n=1 Tax=Thelephora ganbajun TaxID=370292 RepID=A0ACB6ZIJ9_THEGA|nr:hypothetical protein BDM02DRAFT_3114079 [Thelephora ganbajun]